MAQFSQRHPHGHRKRQPQRPLQPCAVVTPARSYQVAVPQQQQPLSVSPSTLSPSDVLSHVLQPVNQDMVTMNANLRDVVGNRHPMLMAAAEQIFGAGGKKLRPVIVFLVARATAHTMGHM